MNVSHLGFVHNVTQQKRLKKCCSGGGGRQFCHWTSPCSPFLFYSVWCLMNMALSSYRSSGGPVAWWWPATLSSSWPSWASSWCSAGETTSAGSSGRPSVDLWHNPKWTPRPYALWTCGDLRFDRCKQYGSSFTLPSDRLGGSFTILFKPIKSTLISKSA